MYPILNDPFRWFSATRPNSPCMRVYRLAPAYAKVLIITSKFNSNIINGNENLFHSNSCHLFNLGVKWSAIEIFVFALVNRKP